jgi:hypothetical protein
MHKVNTLTGLATLFELLTGNDGPYAGEVELHTAIIGGHARGEGGGAGGPAPCSQHQYDSTCKSICTNAVQVLATCCQAVPDTDTSRSKVSSPSEN